MVFCLIVLYLTKALKSTLATFKRPKVAAKLFVTTFLISINWLVYIWATNNGHVVEASLGYYINPLIVIAFGVILLKEKMRPLQWAAVTIASLGVLVLTIDYGRLPWVALGLALSWGAKPAEHRRHGRLTHADRAGQAKDEGLAHRVSNARKAASC